MVYAALDQLCVLVFNGKQLFMCKQHFIRVHVLQNLSEKYTKSFSFNAPPA